MGVGAQHGFHVMGGAGSACIQQGDFLVERNSLSGEICPENDFRYIREFVIFVFVIYV